MPLTLSFQGLCLFADRDSKYYDVFMPPVDGHTPVLLARTEFLEDPAKMSWVPDFVVGSSDDAKAPVQTAVWLLKGYELSFPESCSRLEPWKDRARDCVDLTRFHKDIRTKSVKEIQKLFPGTCSMVLDEGTPYHRRLLEETVSNKYWNVRQPFAHQVTWSNLSTEIRNDKGCSIRFQRRYARTLGSQEDCYATISNLAAAAADFGLYYPLVNLAPGDEPLRMVNLGGEVYDCIPPAPTS